MAAAVSTYVQPTVTFVTRPTRWPPRTRPSPRSSPSCARPWLQGHTERFARARPTRGVLGLGLLDGPGTGHDEPVPALGATLHVQGAARAHLAALELPSGIYNVCRDGELVSNRRFVAAAGWHQRPGMVGAASR